MASKNPINYFKGVYREAKRTRRPKKDQFLPTIAVVVSITLFAAIVLLIEDYVAQYLVQLLRDAFEAIK